MGYPAKVEVDNKYGFIDKTGKEIIGITYDNASYFFNGYAAAMLNEKWGVIDIKGKVIVPFKYDYTDFQSSIIEHQGFDKSTGLLRVAIGEVKWDAGEWYGGKWGFVNKAGKEVIPAQYERAGNFSKGRAKVVLKGKEFYIDKTGKRVN